MVSDYRDKSIICFKSLSNFLVLSQIFGEKLREEKPRDNIVKKKRKAARNRARSSKFDRIGTKIQELFARADEFNAILRPLYFQKLRSSSFALLGDFGRRCRCKSCNMRGETRYICTRASSRSHIDPSRKYVRGLTNVPLGQSAPDTFTLLYICTNV